MSPGASATDLMRRTRPEPIGPLAQLAPAADAGRDRLATAAAAGAAATTATTPSEVRLVLLDRTITPARRAAPTRSRLVLAGAPFTPAELPGLDADEQLVVARRLLREGVLVAG